MRSASVVRILGLCFELSISIYVHGTQKQISHPKGFEMTGKNRDS